MDSSTSSTSSASATPASSLAGVRSRLQAVGDFFARQRHLIAIRDGVVGALPLVLTGSLFLLVAQVPYFQGWLGPYVQVVLVPYRMLGGLIALYVTFCTASSLSRSYSLDAMASGLLAMAAYLIAAFPTPSVAPGAPPAPPALPLARLGAGGIFAGLLIALGTVELQRLLVQRRWTIRLPSTVPEVVARSFLALVPSVVVVGLTFLVVHVLGVDVVSLLERASAPLVVASGGLAAALAVAGIDSAMWLLGVHASAALATMRPLWEVMLLQNQEAASAGAAVLPHVASQHFYLWFVWQGGSGATLAAALLLLRARSAQLKGVSKVALLPSLCNINEPLLFGLPVVLNPALVVPFLVAPALSVLTAYLAFDLDWVRRPYLEVPWTLPAPIGAFLSTRDWRAVVLQLFNLALSMLVYWPFLRRYDLRLLARERAEGSVVSKT